MWRTFGMFTLPDIPWGWIYFGAFVYLILIGPGHYFYGRSSRRDYRMTILVLLAIVGASSWIFTKIGRRGYGESDRWLSASIAYPLGDGNFDVEQWSHAFVTKSDSHSFRFEGNQQLFEVQHQMSKVPGFIRGGPQGYLSLDLPLYSSRNLIGRAIVPGPDIQVDVTEWSSSRPRRLEAEISGDAVIKEAWYRYNNDYYRMDHTRSNTWAAGSRDEEWSNAQHQYAHYNHHRFRNENGRNHLSDLMPNWLLSAHRHRHDQTGEPEDHAELILYAESPETFRSCEP